MGVSGDYAALHGLQARTSEAAFRALAPALAKRLRAASLKLLADEFKQGRDPYGAAWLATKRGNPPLRKSGRMAGSVTAQPNGAEVKVTIGTTYAVYHQKGARMAARSNVRGQTLWHNPKTGKLVSKRTKLKLVHETKAKRATFGDRTLPRRQMLPESSTGGLGSIWSAAFRIEERAVVMAAMGRR